MNLPMVRTRPAPAPELAPAAAFWNDRDDCPDEGTAGREIVDQIIREVA